MFHFFEAITNTKGDALIGYYVKAVDTTTGDVVPIYADASSTPIVSESGVANAALVNSDGNASFYIAGGNYHLDIYATDATTFVRRVQYLPMVDATVAAGNVSSRANLAAVLATTGDTRTLAESGREGLFVYDASDLSAYVSVDTGQGIYVPPSSDTTGASGAWVRRFEGAVNVKWFGAKGDGTTTGVDGPAAVAALALLDALAVNDVSGIYRASQALYFPAGEYLMGTSTLDVTHTVEIYGDGDGQTATPATILQWDAGTPGIRVHHYNTEGTYGVRSPTGSSGSGSIIRNIALYGGYDGVEAEVHGVQLRAPAFINRVVVSGWEGDGIYIVASAGAGAGSASVSPEGNANSFRLSYILAVRNRVGVFIRGADVNAGSLIAINASNNRSWGVRDSSFLGNGHFGHHADANGYMPTGDVLPASRVSYSGNIYSVKLGQETGASTNAPSGTTADNTWWYYESAGAPDVNYYPAWVSGMSLRAGGAYCSDGASARIEFVSCYAEGGSQGTSQVSSGTMVIGGLHGPRIITGTSWAGGVFSSLSATGNLGVFGNSNTIGPQSGTAADNVVSLDCTNVSNTLRFRSWSGGVSNTDFQMVSFRTSGTTYLQPSTALMLGTTAADTVKVDANAVDIQSGKVLKVNGTTVIDSSRNSTPASLASTGAVTSSSATAGVGYATGAGGAVTQATSRTTGVTLNKVCGQITLVSAAGSATYQSFTVTNSTVAATDTIRVNQVSGTDLYEIHVTAVTAGSFRITFRTTGGTTTEQPVFNFAVIKAVAA